MLRAGVDVLGIGLERGARRDRTGRTAGCATEGSDAFGESVDMLPGMVGDLVEEFVQGDEVRTLDVPVRLLGLQPEIDGVDEARVEQVDDLLTGLQRQVIAGLVHAILQWQKT